MALVNFAAFEASIVNFRSSTHHCSLLRMNCYFRLQINSKMDASCLLLVVVQLLLSIGWIGPQH